MCSIKEIKWEKFGLLIFFTFNIKQSSLPVWKKKKKHLNQLS